MTADPVTGWRKPGRLVVAVVGAGPSGIYAAEALTQASGVEVEVAVIDRLPVPFGLVRYGVAPDHPSIRSIRTTLERTLEKPGVHFFGDVMIGRDLTVDELRGAVDAVVYAWGAGTSRSLGVVGEDATGSLSAADFVAWYCGHPDAHPDAPGSRIDHDQPARLLAEVTSAVVVGAGNVALDVVRILIKDADDLATTDMADGVLAAMRSKKITDVHLLARRGPGLTQMTTKELRELGTVEGCDVILYPDDLDWQAESLTEISKVAQRNLVEFSQWANGSRRLGAGKRVHLHFWTRPTMINTRNGRVTGVEFEDSRPGVVQQGSVQAQLVVRAIGYKGVELPGVPFDADTGRVPHVDGRVLAEPDGVSFQTGEYVTGWIKRGPTGVIGTNKSDAVETVNSLLHDLEGGDLTSRHHSLADLTTLLSARGITPLDLHAWHRIDAAEIDRGHAHGRDRATLAHRSELLAAAGPLGSRP